MFGKHRIDYLIDRQQDDGGREATLAIKQVEMNTFAAGCSSVASRVAEFHRWGQEFLTKLVKDLFVSYT